MHYDLLIYLSMIVSGFFTSFLIHSKLLEFAQNRETLNKPTRDIKLLCWIMTCPKNRERWDHIVDTWAHKCSQLIFVTSDSEPSNRTDLKVIEFPVNEGRGYLYEKTRRAFNYVYENLTDYDWVLKADDDT